MAEFPSKMEHTQKKVEVLKPQNKVLMWFLSEVALLEKGWTVTEGFNSVSKWMEKSLLPFSLEKKMQVISQDSVLKRPGRNQILGRRCFGVPEDLHVSSTEFPQDGKTAPIKKRKHTLDGSMDRKRPQNRDVSLAQPCLTFS